METQMGTAASLLGLIAAFPSLRKKGLLRQVVGTSERNLRARAAKDPGLTLTLDQSERARQVSEILLQAAAVLGSEAATDAWMAGKAIGLGNRAPIDLMLTPEGQLALREHLVRLEYGVYC